MRGGNTSTKSGKSRGEMLVIFRGRVMCCVGTSDWVRCSGRGLGGGEHETYSVKVEGRV